MDWLYFILIILGCYLIGAIPTGYVLVKQLKGIDIRTVGSGSTGATNVKRVLGTKFFFIVLLLDMLKGLVPLIALQYLNYAPEFLPDINYLTIICGIVLIFGHSKSVFIKFSGGKSIATSIGVFLALCWQATLIAVIIAALIIYISKYVSLGSIVSILLMPVLMWLFDQPLVYVIFSLVSALYVAFYLHRQNIQRLLSGTENKTSF